VSQAAKADAQLRFSACAIDATGEVCIQTPAPPFGKVKHGFLKWDFTARQGAKTGVSLFLGRRTG
jgi:hypothetical protein